MFWKFIKIEKKDSSSKEQESFQEAASKELSSPTSDDKSTREIQENSTANDSQNHDHQSDVSQTSNSASTSNQQTMENSQNNEDNLNSQKSNNQASKQSSNSNSNNQSSGNHSSDSESSSLEDGQPSQSKSSQSKSQGSESLSQSSNSSNSSEIGENQELSDNQSSGNHSSDSESSSLEDGQPSQSTSSSSKSQGSSSNSSSQTGDNQELSDNQSSGHHSSDSESSSLEDCKPSQSKSSQSKSQGSESLSQSSSSNSSSQTGENQELSDNQSSGNHSSDSESSSLEDGKPSQSTTSSSKSQGSSSNSSSQTGDNQELSDNQSSVNHSSDSEFSSLEDGQSRINNSSSLENKKNDSRATGESGENQGQQNPGAQEIDSRDSETQNGIENQEDQATKENTTDVSQSSQGIINPDPSQKLTTEQKKALLEKLKNSIAELQKAKAARLARGHIEKTGQESSESVEEKYELSEQTNNFLNRLGELPSFEDRSRGAGYSIDTGGTINVNEALIRTLITKFLNQRFRSKNSDLNVRSSSLDEAYGFYEWNVKDAVIHLSSEQYTKLPDDKYGYEYEHGKDETVALSFYFDLSGSMSEYSSILASIAIELLKKGVKVLIGFNERVNVQIESIEKNITTEELAEILESAGYNARWISSGYRQGIRKDPRVKFKYIDKNIDNYLIEKKGEKCVVFSDFDPIREVINLSQAVDTYWFCFESRFSDYSLKGYNGFIYKVRNVEDIARGLIKVNEKRFEALCYIDNPKTLQKL